MILFLQFSAVIFLVGLNGFFVAAEFALVKVRDTQLQPLDERGSRRARVARRVLKNLDAMLSATQLGITLASLGLGYYAEPFFESLLEPILESSGVHDEGLRHLVAFAFGFGVITIMHIVMGELAPKSIAIQKPMGTSLAVAQPLSLFYKLTFPAIKALNGMANLTLKAIGFKTVSEHDQQHSEEEIKLLLQSSQKSLGATALERNIVINAMELRERRARDVMKPRRAIEFFDTSATIETCVEKAKTDRYSRYPLCRNGDVDDTVGILHFKDIVTFEGGRTAADLESIARPIIYISEFGRLSRLLKLFLEKKSHFAIVVDEYGTTIGMVTLEDVLEELVGQIQDEFDHETPLVTKRSDSEWVILGQLPLHELEDITGVELDDDEVTSTSGWITRQLGRFPQEGDRVELEGHHLEVLETDGPRAGKVAVRKIAAASGENPTNDSETAP